MSEDGFSSDCFEEPNMEIQIDTLLGTSFDMRCSSTDTVREIKQRIQRVEGIPVHQQNLIFQSNELKDSRRLCDAGIRNGSTIRLVTTMKGGPISTRRLSVSCEHHMVIKELKELLENTRDEVGDKLTPGAKVSVLVFKEGDILNLLRVIENEDGSYSPYSEKPISPPAKPARKDAHLAMFEKLVEDTDMMTKISNLRKKMEDVSLRKQKRHGGRHNNNNAAGSSSSSNSGTNNFERTSHFISSKLRTGGLSFYRRNLNLDELAQSSGSSSSSSLITNTDEFVAGGGGGGGGGGGSSRNHHGGNVSYKLLAECTNDMLDNIDLKIFEKNLDDGHSETEEIALKDKHRIKPQRKSSSHNRSLYSKSKGALSLTKQSYARIHKRTRDLRDLDSAAYAAFGMRETKIEENDDYEEDEDEYCDEDEDNELFVDPTEELLLPASYNSSEPLVTASCVSTGKQKKNIHLTRLVLTTTDGVLDHHHHHHRPKSSPTTSAETIVDSLELEESAAQDLWEIHESSSAADRLKHCNFGVLKRRQSLDYSAYDDLVDQPSTSTASKKLQQHDLCSEEYDYCNEALCSGGNIFHMPHLVSPTATCGGIPVSSNAHGGASVNTIPQEQFMSNTGKNSNSDDYFLSGGGSTAGSKNGRSPLYGRTKTEDLLGTASSGVGSTGRSKLPEIKTNVGSGTSEVTSATKYSFLSGDCASTIQRLKNDCCHSNNNNNNGEPSSSSVKSSDNLVFDSTDENPAAATNSATITNSATSATITNSSSGVGGLDKIYGYYNLAISGSSTSGAQDFLGEKVLHQKRDYATRPLNRNSLGHQLHHRELEVLPPVIQKKKARCSECNKRLNITNIYNCRCGRVFCSQHRYSEVHGCTYDYKTEGRRILEHQNPLVTAEKVNRI